MNCVQYTRESFTHKEQAIKLLQKANIPNKTPVYYKEEPSLQELTQLLETGHIIRRGGDSTTFAWVDCDNTNGENIHIDKARSILGCWTDMAIVQSSSGSVYKYHIIQEIPDTPKEYIKDACSRLKTRISSLIPTLTYDNKCDSFYQNLFGSPQTTPTKIHLLNSKRIAHLTNDNVENVRVATIDEVPPYSSSEYAKRIGVLELDEGGYRCDVSVPIRSHGKFHPITKGKRYNWSVIIAKKLLLRAFHLKHNCNYPITQAVYMNWVDYTLNTCCTKDASMRSIRRDISNYAKSLYTKHETWTFDRIYKEYSDLFSDKEKPAKSYRSNAYLRVLVSELILKEWLHDDEILVDQKNHTVVFKNRERLERIAMTRANASYRAFVNAGLKYGWTITWSKELPTDDLAMDSQGRYVVPRGAMTRRLRTYLYRHQIPYVIPSAKSVHFANNKSATFLHKDISIEDREEEDMIYFNKNVAHLEETSKKCRNLVKNEENKKVKCTQRGLREAKVLHRIARIKDCIANGVAVSKADEKFMRTRRDVFPRKRGGRAKKE